MQEILQNCPPDTPEGRVLVHESDKNIRKILVSFFAGIVDFSIE